MPLLNLTNHPHQGWSPKQKKAARRYGKLIDLPFPKVGPLATTEEVKGLARGLFFQILEFQALADGEITVHLMGEMTLTYALLRLLKEEGIAAIASTTERQVTMNEDGSRQIMFNFQQFRAYW